MKKFLDYLYGLIWVFVASLSGWLLFLVVFNLLIKAGLASTETMDYELTRAITEKVAYAWMGTTILAFVSLFVKKPISIYLRLLPVIIPSLLSVVLVMSV